MTISANSSGALTGRFTIPASIPAGIKVVRLTGNAGSVAQAVFRGGGVLERTLMQRTINDYMDPLAQTFTLPSRAQIGAIDLWINVAGTTVVKAQIRETEVGVPTPVVLAEALLDHTAITAAAYNRFTFPVPVTLQANQEYALVIMCDDATASAGVAELGKIDILTNDWVTSQPYNIGVLLASSNASTWTPFQDRDLTFKLMRRTYSENSRTIGLGVVAVTGVTDMMVMAMLHLPDESTNIHFTLTLPDASVLTVANRQVVRLPSAITGNVTVAAVLAGSPTLSPVLWPGTLLLHGVIGAAGTYVTRAILCGSTKRVRFIYDGLLPPGATGVVAYKLDSGSWTTLTLLGSTAGDNGWRTYTHEVSSLTGTVVACRLTLNGTTAARPYAQNIRLMVM